MSRSASEEQRYKAHHVAILEVEIRDLKAQLSAYKDVVEAAANYVRLSADGLVNSTASQGWIDEWQESYKVLKDALSKLPEVKDE